MARTWGQIRQLLKQRYPVLHLDLLTSNIQGAYNQILDRQSWSQLSGDGRIQTVAKVDVDGLTVTQGSVTVTGTGFDAAWENRRFRIAGLDGTYTIVEVTSGTSMALDRSYDKDTAADVAGYVFRNVYDLPPSCKSIESVTNPETGLPLLRWSQQEIDEHSVERDEFGEPSVWAPASSAIEGEVEPVVQQIELYPIPERGYSYPYRFQKSAMGYDGTNGSGLPLPWVSDDAILALASAKCCAEPAVQQDPTFYLGESERYIRQMVTQDAARTVHRLRAADSMTRHDRKRLAR